MSEQPEKTDRTSDGLRHSLFDAIDKVRSGEMTPQNAKAIASLAGQIVATVNMEISIAQLRRDYPADTPLTVPPPLKLTKKDA